MVTQKLLTLKNPGRFNRGGYKDVYSDRV